MTPQEEVRRAERARQILEEPLFQEAVAAIEKALLAGIAKSAFTDAALREKLCQRYALLHDLVDQLGIHIQTGRLAQEQIAQAAWRAKLKERLANWSPF